MSASRFCRDFAVGRWLFEGGLEIVPDELTVSLALAEGREQRRRAVAMSTKRPVALTAQPRRPRPAGWRSRLAARGSAAPAAMSSARLRGGQGHGEAGGEISTGNLATAVGADPDSSSFKRPLADLVERGHIEKVSRGRYRITDEGHKLAALPV